MEVDDKTLDDMKATIKEAVEFTAEVQPVLQKAAEVEAQVAARVPALVDSLIKRGFIEPEIRDAAVKNLQDPLRMIDAMDKLAALQTKPVAEKAASVPSMGAPAASTKVASTEKPIRESDMVFLKGFGLLH